MLPVICFNLIPLFILISSLMFKKSKYLLKVILLGYAVLKSNLSVGAVVTVLSLLTIKLKIVKNIS